jgi:Zn-dependent protease with chaperone function
LCGVIGVSGDTAARSSWGGLAFLLLAGFACAASAQMRSWPAASIANDPAEHVELPDARGNAVATVPRELVRQILQVQERLQQPSGFSGELFIVTGKGPNAFAASVRGRRIIGITVPMLDLLGDDLDAYAALLGHEIAHHTRQHSVERRSREQSLAGAGRSPR